MSCLGPLFLSLLGPLSRSGRSMSREREMEVWSMCGADIFRHVNEARDVAKILLVSALAARTSELAFLSCHFPPTIATLTPPARHEATHPQ